MGDIDELIQEGWQRHEEAPQALAADLEANRELANSAEAAVRFLRLSNLTIGAHLNDWPRAVALAHAVASRMASDPNAAKVLAELAVALAGWAFWPRWCRPPTS